MRLHEYQKLALVTCTEKAPDTLSGEMMQLIHGCLGVTTEIAELYEHENELYHPNVKAEIGDICWYVAIALDAVFFDMEDVEFRIEGAIEEPLPYLVSAGGYLNNIIKRSIFYGEELDSDQVVYWCARILEALDVLSREIGTSLHTCMEKNIEKLQKRYEGKFSKLKAIQRDERNEAKVFEDEG